MLAFDPGCSMSTATIPSSFPYREKAHVSSSRNSQETANQGSVPRLEESAEICYEVPSQYWDGLGVDEQLPSLCIVNGSNDISSDCTNIPGRRVVSVIHHTGAEQPSLR